MTELLLLYALGSVHAGFAGWREASGRNLLVRKRAYYWRATLRGLAVGQLASALIFAVLLALYLGSGDGPLLLERLGRACRPALATYLGYTGLVVLAYAPYLPGGVEARTLTIVCVFGPLTLGLPFVMLAGAALSLATSPGVELAVLLGSAVTLTAMVEPVLLAAGWSRRDAERCMSGADAGRSG